VYENESITSWKSERLLKHQKCTTFNSKGATGEFSQKLLPSMAFKQFNLLLTNNLPIYPDQQAEDHENIKQAKQFIPGEQLGSFWKKLPPK
jgi:hypothetical protein